MRITQTQPGRPTTYMKHKIAWILLFITWLQLANAANAQQMQNVTETWRNRNTSNIRDGGENEQLTDTSVSRIAYGVLFRHKLTYRPITAVYYVTFGVDLPKLPVMKDLNLNHLNKQSDEHFEGEKRIIQHDLTNECFQAIMRNESTDECSHTNNSIQNEI
jgi:hypothetical protein